MSSLEKRSPTSSSTDIGTAEKQVEHIPLVAMSSITDSTVEKKIGHDHNAGVNFVSIPAPTRSSLDQNTSTLIDSESNNGEKQIEQKKGRGAAFWFIILGLNVAAFLAFLEGTIVSNALPIIVNSLHGVDFVWAATAYNLAASCCMPVTGALAQILGRKPVLMGSLLLFSVGSVLCGASQNMAMLIAGRAVQGAGGGGIFSSTAIILSDIVSLSERGAFNGIMQLTWCLASGIGPITGGSLAQKGSWRWIFYLNLPIAAVAGGMMVTTLKLKTPRRSMAESLQMLDWVGNVLIAGGVVSFTIGLVWGGVTFPWTSAKVLAPLIIGGVGLVAFMIYEYKWSPQPLLPVKLMMNRTTLSGYLQVFIFPIPFIAIVYYLPIYFQACKGASPVRSGVLLFGISFSTPPLAMISGILVTTTKRYREQLWTGWAICVVGLALLGTTHADTSLAKVIGYEVLTSAGFGIVFATTYFPILAPLPVTSVAQALAFFSFLRQFTQILGISIGGVIVQNQLVKKLPSAFLEQFSEGGQAISVVPQLSTLPPAELAQVQEAFADSFGLLWNVMAAIAGAGLLASFLMRNYSLHTKVDEDWGINESKEKPLTQD